MSRALTVRQVRHLLANEWISSKDLCLYCRNLAVAGEEVWGLNAFSRLVSLEEILMQAEESDERRRTGRILSPLDGIPISIKCNIAVESQPLTAGSRILGEMESGTTATTTRTSTSQAPAATAGVGYNADVVQSLRESGAIIVGMNTMDEFGMGSLGTHHAGIGPTKNPLPYLRRMTSRMMLEDNNLATAIGTASSATASNGMSILDRIKSPAEVIHAQHESAVLRYNDEQRLHGFDLLHLNKHHRRSADDFEYKESDTKDVDYYYDDDYSIGGSSCGGAASVAHGSSLISLGSDTGGSVRLPAAWSSLVGLKPSYGCLSRHGLVSYASSMDTVGILARSSACIATTLEVLLRDPRQRRQRQQKPGSQPPLEKEVEEEEEEEEEIRDSNRFQGYYWEEDLFQDNREPLSAAAPPPPQSASSSSLGRRLEGVTVGLPEAFSVEECPEWMREAWMQAAERLESYGATIQLVNHQQLSPRVLHHSLAAYYVLVSAEASSNLARYDRFRYGAGAGGGGGGVKGGGGEEEGYCNNGGPTSNESLEALLNEWGNTTKKEESQFTLLEYQFAKARSEGFGDEVIRRILCGTAVLSSDRFHTYYEAAAKLRAVLTQQLHSCLSKQEKDNDGLSCNVLLVPTALSLPPKLRHCHNNSSQQHQKNRPVVEVYANDVMTVPASLAGLPAISVPWRRNAEKIATTGEEEVDSPLFCPALQLIGPRMSERKLLTVAQFLEQQQQQQQQQHPSSLL